MQIIEDKNKKTETYRTNNEGFGFNAIGDQFSSWGAARCFDQLAEELVIRGVPDDVAIRFLDSRMARHLADSVSVQHTDGDPDKIAKAALAVLKTWAQKASMKKDLQAAGVLQAILR